MAKKEKKTPKIFTSEDATRKMRELLGGLVGVSAKSIKVTPNYKLGRPELTVPKLSELSKEKQEAIKKADDAFSFIIKAL